MAASLSRRALLGVNKIMGTHSRSFLTWFTRSAEESAARTDLLKQQAKQAEAQADAVRKQADAQAKQAEAQADAVRKQADAQAKQADAQAKQADALAQQVDADTKAKAKWEKIKTASFWGTGVLLGVTVILLAIDWVRHESELWIRYRVKQHLLRLQLPEAAVKRLSKLPPAGSPLRFTHHQMPSLDDGLALLLLGPTGCGKSLLLAQIAEATLKQGIPTALLNFRLEKTDKPQNASIELDSIAGGVFAAIGFPSRAWWPLHVLNKHFSSVSISSGVQMTIKPAGTASRLKRAVGTLYAVCDDLHQQRQADPAVPKEQARCVVLIDELQDLLRHDSLRNVGGDVIASEVARSVLNTSVQTETVKTVATGSSSFLLLSLQKDTLLSEDRLEVEQLEHAPKEAAIKALVGGKSYRAEDAEAIWRVTGGKLRDLSRFLSVRVPDAAVHAKLTMLASRASGAIQSAFSECDPAAPGLSTDEKQRLIDDRRMLVATLDGVCKGDEVFQDSLPVRLRSEAKIGKVFYLRAYPRVLALQSDSIGCEWPKLRSKYTQ